MPYRLETDKEHVDVYVTMLSPVTPAELSAYFTELMQMYDSFDGKRCLILADQVRITGLNYRSIREFAQLTRKFEPQLAGSVTALVTPGNVAFGLVRMYLSVRDPAYKMAVFKEEAAALNWLADARLR